jgi:hypothetical protein
MQAFSETNVHQEDRYIGHIYCYNEIVDSKAEFIGIRESMYSTLQKIYNKNNSYRGIAYSLLDSCVEYGRILKVKQVCLSNPIGIMPVIAKKYGFVDDKFDI